MAGIVNHDVGSAKLFDHLHDKLHVLLQPDANVNLIFLKRGTLWTIVESNNSDLRAKILLPQLQRPALSDTNLYQRNRLAKKPLEVPVVNIEVLWRLVRHATLVRL